MRQRNLITCGLDDPSAERLHERVVDLGIGLRKTRDAAACLNLLRQGAGAVVVLRVGRDLETEFTLLADITRQYPQTATLVIGDVELPSLANLAWDLGAHCVLIGEEGHDMVHDVVAKMLQS